MHEEEAQQPQGYHGYTILELLGHRTRAGYVTEETIAGAGLLRIEIPGPEGTTTTEYYNPGSLYALSPVSEEVARAVAARNQPAPVHPWELRPERTPRALVTHQATYDDSADDDEDQEEGDLGL